MHQIDKSKFGAFVSALRKEKGMTQKELSACLNISDKAVSKWETGVSIPDVTMLMPLAETLGVTVTELLECRRMEPAETIPAVQVEQIVQTTLRLNGEEPPERKATRIGAYLGCLIGAGMELVFLSLRGFPPERWSVSLLLCELFGLIFGGYFMVFAKDTLPEYHDHYRINGMLQGMFRMNLPGLAFNNRNWPHMLTVGRIWSMGFLIGYPMVYFLLYSFLPGFWSVYETGVMTTLQLATLFLPLYYVGKRYE